MPNEICFTKSKAMNILYAEFEEKNTKKSQLIKCLSVVCDVLS